MPSMEALVRWTIACTWSDVRVTPLRVSTKTDAVGSRFSDTKTVSSGIASRTEAVFTPLSAPIVLASSPSSARLYVTSCWNSDAVTPIESSSE
jgi:hypothetical protein